MRLNRITTTLQSDGEGIYAFLYCYSEQIALTIRFVKKLKNGKYLIENNELIPFSLSSTPNGKMLLLYEDIFYKVIEPVAPLVVLMNA
jgi:hypothetical protein